MSSIKKFNKLDPFLLVLLGIGFIWARSSFGKLEGGKFVDTLGGTLGKFASKNTYPFFKQFLEQVAIPNYKIFGTLTMWGEALSALAILTGTILFILGKRNRFTKLILILGLAVGAFLNAIFWMASGWTSPSTDGLNLIMFVAEVSAIFWVLKE